MAVVSGKALWFLSICFLATDALFFHISETETKCFIEEVPDETLIVGGCSEVLYIYYRRCLWYATVIQFSYNRGLHVNVPLYLCVCFLAHL